MKHRGRPGALALWAALLAASCGRAAAAAALRGAPRHGLLRGHHHNGRPARRRHGAARTAPASAQERLRTALHQDRRRTLAQAGSLSELRQEVRERAAGLPVGAEVQAVAAAAGEIQSLSSVQSATAQMNALLTSARLELDQKMIECHKLPERLAARAQETSLQEQQVSLEISYQRALVVSSAGRSPADHKHFQELKSDLALRRRACARDREESKQRAWALQEDSRSMEVAQGILESQCNASDASLVQMSTEECTTMEAELDEISGMIYDNEMRLKADDNARAKDCEEVKEFDREEMVGASREQTNLHEDLSRATAALSSLTYRQGELEDLRARDEKDLRDARAQCFEDVHRTLSSTICGLTKVRDSLWLLAGSTELPVDCEVTDWVDHACSATCGKGTRQSTREVIVESQNGTGCPPLEMVQECENVACPTDCTVSEWSGWSKCSAVCDGGVQERTRAALTEARNGGDACPQLVETQVCNQPPCDSDCRVGEWSDWSQCSKVCGGGSQHRQREVIGPARGVGGCGEGMRWETQTCNSDACSSQTTAYTCAGNWEDIVLVVDSSGAVNETEFELLQELAETVLTGYAPAAGAAHVAVVAMGATASKASGLEADEDTITASISGLTQDEGATMLGSSLSLASTVLRQDGRSRAFWTVVVLAAGMVADPYEAEQARRLLERRGARVVLAVTGSENLSPATFLARFASEPASENLIYVPLNSTTDMTSAANTVIASTCSAVS